MKKNHSSKLLVLVLFLLTGAIAMLSILYYRLKNKKTGSVKIGSIIKTQADYTTPGTL